MTTRPAMTADNLQFETTAKACRAALWLALLQAQQLGWSDITDELMAMLRDVDQRRATLEASATATPVTDDGRRLA